MGFLDKTLFWFKTASELGQVYLLSRKAHIEENLTANLPDDDWFVLATKEPVSDGAPVYGFPAYKPVRPGQRFWVFVEEGEYWLYAVRGSDAREALKRFYADPDDAELLASPVISEPGFRADIEEQIAGESSSE